MLQPKPFTNQGDAHVPPGAIAPGTVVLNRYVIQRILGHGGMATVYLARHQTTEKYVALKFLDPGLSQDPSYVERFRREAKAAGRIRSDYVVSIFDLDADQTGALVLVMEYLVGQSIQEAMRQGRMEMSRVVRLGRQLLDGLATAHEAGVIHRDLKPANLYLEQTSDGVERLKILDFGISKVSDNGGQELTQAGQTLGTVAYMAPEQVRGKAIPGDPRVDLYAAGVTLFIMMTGRRPIDAEDTVALLAAVLENPPLTLQQAAGVPFPAEIEAFFHRALQKDPNHRFQSAREMKEALVHIARVLGLDAMTGPLPNFATPPLPAGYEPIGPGATSGVRMRTDSAPQPVAVPSIAGPPVASPHVPQITGTYPGATTTAPPHPAAHAPPMAATGQFPSQPMGMQVPDAFPALPPPVAKPATPSSEESSGRSPLVMILGLVALLAVGGVGAVLFMRSRTPAPTGSDTTTVTAPPTTPVVQPTTPTTPTPPAVGNPTPETTQNGTVAAGTPTTPTTPSANPAGNPAGTTAAGGTEPTPPTPENPQAGQTAQENPQNHGTEPRAQETNTGSVGTAAETNPSGGSNGSATQANAQSGNTGNTTGGNARRPPRPRRPRGIIAEPPPF